MKISELTPRQGNVNLTAEVAEVGETRTFNKFGKDGKVANATLKDSSGKIMMTLWNEQTGLIKQGDTIEIKNGYVNEWQGEMQLTTGKFGTLEVVPGSAKIESKKEEKNSVEEEELSD